jgi:hypothetical protein
MNNDIVASCKFALKKPLYRPTYAVRRWLARNDASRQISKIDSTPVPDKRQEIRLFMVVRNASLRLPFMLDYYFSQGVDRIFVLDNDSSDDTRDIILSKKDAHLFYTKDKYAHQSSWVDLLLRRFGIGHWCLIVDADEMLVYPHYERTTLQDLCVFLDKESFDAMDCVLLDMYTDSSLNAIEYTKGMNPLLVAPFFDRKSYTTARGPVYMSKINVIYKGPERMYGGMRKRMFGIDACLSKFPLVKYNKSMFLSAGTHFVHGARAADLRGALLHFKYLNDFSARVKEEVKREAHWDNAFEYKGYLKTLNRSYDIRFCSNDSEKFRASVQLVDLGIMKSSERLDYFSL